jgi:SAM-dependent methyltransferase
MEVDAAENTKGPHLRLSTSGAGIRTPREGGDPGVSLAYRLMYLVGFTPWDRDEVPRELRDTVEGPAALAPGHALDIGCGTGTQAVYLASIGWSVTAVDAVARPLERARARGAAAGVEVDWRHHDVARLSELALERDVSFVFDRGCYHGLAQDERDAYARGVEEVAAEGATLLLMAFAPNRKPFGPSGAAKEELLTRFGEPWRLVTETPATERSPSGPMSDVPLSWYRFER